MKINNSSIFTSSKSLKSPFIACFKTSTNKYIYDVNTNEIILVSDVTYDKLLTYIDDKKQSIDSNVIRNSNDPAISALIKQGYLSSNRPCKMILPYKEEYVSSLHESKIEQCVMELTQACNQNCNYCSYSTKFPGRRNHSNKTMSWTIAKKTIDYYLDHSINSNMRTLGFYGGEPLIEWGLLKKCIKYIRSNDKGKGVSLNITTNGTLITDTIAKFLAVHKVKIYVSIDGPKDVHEMNRVFTSGEKGTYDSTVRGLKILKRHFKSSYTDDVYLSCVYGPWVDLVELHSFYSMTAPKIIKALKENIILIQASYPSGQVNGLTNINSDFEDSIIQLEIKWFDSLKGVVKIDQEEKQFLRQIYQEPYLTFYSRDYKKLQGTHYMSGMCVPGHRKIFVDVDGKILPCERVSEKDEFVIGDINENGLNVKKCINMLNKMLKYFESKCLNCILCRVCSGCITSLYNTDGNLSEESVAAFCDDQKKGYESVFYNWVSCLEKNPACFDYMEKIRKMMMNKID